MTCSAVIADCAAADVAAERTRCAAIVRAKADHIRRAVPASDVSAEAFKFAVTMLEQCADEIDLGVANLPRDGQ